MKILTLALALIFTLIAPVTNGVSLTDPTLSTYQVFNVDDSVMREIAQKFEVTRKLKNGYEIYVPINQTHELLKLAPYAKLIEEDNNISLRNLKLSPLSSEYHKFNQVIEKLQKLAEEKPNLVQFVQYGKSADERPLFAIKISDNVSLDEDEPELMITAATHGDEIITTEIVLNLIDKLIAGYGSDPRLTKMVNDHELYFIPVVNADGFANQTRYDKGVDPNRSYPYPENPSAKPTASIAALIEFFNSRNFVGSLDYHAYGELTMYPWAYTYDSVTEKDQKNFDELTKRMAKTNGYTYGPISKVIYIAPGSSADYYYWTKNTLAIAVEVGNDKAPSPTEFNHYTSEQTESTWLFIENF